MDLENPFAPPEEIEQTIAPSLREFREIISILAKFAGDSESVKVFRSEVMDNKTRNITNVVSIQFKTPGRVGGLPCKELTLFIDGEEFGAIIFSPDHFQTIVRVAEEAPSQEGIDLLNLALSKANKIHMQLQLERLLRQPSQLLKSFIGGFRDGCSAIMEKK